MQDEENEKNIYNTYSVARYPICDKSDIKLYDADIESQDYITYE